MKKILAWLFSIAALSISSAFAQDTISMRVVLDGLHEAPPNSSQLQNNGGAFLFDPANVFFAGSVGLIDFNVTAVTIFRAMTVNETGMRLYDFTPGGIVHPGTDGSPGSREFDISLSLSPAEKADLLAGSWWVNVVTAAYPNGEVRGQIVPVPEPTAIALISLGILAMGRKILKTQKRERDTTCANHLPLISP